MDDLERRLREDAEVIRADVPPQLTARIASSVRGARALPPARRESGWRPLWLGASLTGAAVAAMVIVSLYRADMKGDPLPAETVAGPVPDYVRGFERQLPLRVKTADLTAPLEEELRNLRSDLERAREDVEQDLDFTF